MIAFPFFVSIDVVFTEEADIFACDRCNRKDASIHPQNTRYENDCDNYVVLCEECKADNDTYWEQMWKDYYRGCL